MPRVFVYVLQRNGAVDDSAAELAAAARRIDAGQSPVAVVTGSAPDLDAACATLRERFAETWRIASEQLAQPDAELVRSALAGVLPRGSIVLASHTHFGIDLCPGLSIRMDAAFASDVVAIERLQGTRLRLVRQEFGGAVSAHVECDISNGAVLTLRPGAFAPLEQLPASGELRAIDPGLLVARRRRIGTIEPEAGDVDITKYKALVSIGRGIGEPENVRIAQELAEALGGAVSCSRPVVDAHWMDKSRQVGSSGKTVKPKVYLACGISGSFQHLAGLKGNPFLVAINKNPRAPIFRAAHVGIVDDLLEFLPELTKKVRAEQGVAAK